MNSFTMPTFRLGRGFKFFGIAAPLASAVLLLTSCSTSADKPAPTAPEAKATPSALEVCVGKWKGNGNSAKEISAKAKAAGIATPNADKLSRIDDRKANEICHQPLKRLDWEKAFKKFQDDEFPKFNPK